MDAEADHAQGLDKLAKKTKIKATQAAVAGSDLLVEAALDIPKFGQDLPQAGRNTKDAAVKLANGDYKGALRSGGRAIGLLGREAGRLSVVGGVSKKLGKKLLQKGEQGVAEEAGVVTGKKGVERGIIKYDSKTGKYIDSSTGMAELSGEPQVPLTRPPTLSRFPSYLSRGLHRPRTPASSFG